MVKYSIVMPYLKRDGWLFNTLVSYNHHYKNRNDYEVIIVEDIKNIENNEEHNKLKEVLKFFTINADKYIDIKLIKSNFVDNHNPAPLFNLGVKNASGKYIVITNPEGFHKDNILAGFDSIFDEKPECYVVCGCLNIHRFKLFTELFEDFRYEPLAWYQHSKYRNAMFHFCSCLSKENYKKIGGFDERFAKGFAYDDDDLRETIKENNIQFVIRDDLLTFHQAHASTVKGINIDRLLKRNYTLYCLKRQKKSDEEIEIVLNSI